jgi:hypothetical protein
MVFLRPITYVTITMANTDLLLRVRGEAQELRRQRLGFGLDPSNLKHNNGESSELPNIQLPIVHDTCAFGSNHNSSIEETPAYLDGFLDAGLGSEFTEASPTNTPTWADQTDFGKGSFNHLLESIVNFQEENTLTGFDSTSDAEIHGSELRTTYAAQQFLTPHVLDCSQSSKRHSHSSPGIQSPVMDAFDTELLS